MYLEHNFRGKPECRNRLSKKNGTIVNHKKNRWDYSPKTKYHDPVILEISQPSITCQFLQYYDFIKIFKNITDSVQIFNASNTAET